MANLSLGGFKPYCVAASPARSCPVLGLEYVVELLKSRNKAQTRPNFK